LKDRDHGSGCRVRYRGAPTPRGAHDPTEGNVHDGAHFEGLPVVPPLRFRGGLVFKVHRLLYHSTLGLRVITEGRRTTPAERGAGASFKVSGSGVRDSVFGFQCSGFGVREASCSVFRVSCLGIRVSGVRDLAWWSIHWRMISRGGYNEFSGSGFRVPSLMFGISDFGFAW